MSKKFQLKNGLKVLLLESHKSPVVSVQMWVRTGSADEAKGEEGISHFIEHLVFKGTQKYKVGEIASVVEGSGGELNAYTSFDQTVFYVTISKEFTDTALDVISEMMGFPQFDSQEIDNEREVVIEEIKRGNDSPGRRASQMLFSTAFKKHPYGLPVIGFDKVIKKISAKKIQQYFNARYCPRNMFLVVAGDINTPEIKKKIERQYGQFHDYKVKKVRRKKETKQTSPRLSIEKSNFAQSIAYLAWKIPNIKHKDAAALDVLALILGQGDSSRLTKTLRIDAPIVNSVGASSFTPTDEGLLTISFGYEKENLEPALSGIIHEIKNICEAPPSAEEMQKAVTCLASEQFYSVETVDGIARKAGSDEFYMGDHDYFKRFLKQVYSLTPEDIQAVAAKYFKIETLSACFLTNEEKGKVRILAKKFMKNLSKELSTRKRSQLKKRLNFKAKKFNIASKTQLAEPKIQRYTFENGLTVLLRQQRETPTTSIRAAYMAGTRIEQANQMGLTEMVARTWTTATANYSEEQINHKIDSLAAGFSAFGGRNSAGLSADFLSPYTEDMLDLFAEGLLRPLFDETILEREKTILKNQIKSRNDNPAQICILQFMQNIFAGHPYARDPMGTNESIGSLTPKILRDYFRQISHPQNLTICAVGDFEANSFADKLHRISQHLPAGQKLTSQFTIAPLEQDQRHYTKLDREQTHIVLGYRGLTLTDERRYALHILQSILAGQGGRLFLELRDKNSLAYSVSPLRMEGIETGYFGAYIGCSPEKAEKAISMMRDEFKKLVDTKVSEEELDRAKRYIVGRHDIDLQRKSSVCHTILFDEIYGNEPSEGLHIAKKIQAITADQIQKLAQQIFSQKSIISSVGSREPQE